MIGNRPYGPGTRCGPRQDPSLPPRLRAVGDLVPPGTSVADVGAGDGLLCLWLLACGRCRACIATERDAGAGARLLGLREAPPRLQVRLGDGLRALREDDRPEILVISGRGARSTLGILQAAEDWLARFGRLVLQPQTETGRLRRWLVEHDWAIVDERMTLDRSRIYVALAAEARPAARPDAHPVLGFDDLLEAGPRLVRSGDPVVREYWRRVKARLDGVIRNATAGSGRTRALRERALAHRVLASLDPDD